MTEEKGPFGILEIPKYSRQPIPEAMLRQLYLNEQLDPI